MVRPVVWCKPIVLYNPLYIAACRGPTSTLAIGFRMFATVFHNIDGTLDTRVITFAQPGGPKVGDFH
jgi:hypothetical protein